MLRVIIFMYYTLWQTLKKMGFQAYFKKNYNGGGQIDTPPPRSLCNSGRPDQLGLTDVQAFIAMLDTLHILPWPPSSTITLLPQLGVTPSTNFHMYSILYLSNLRWIDSIFI